MAAKDRCDSITMCIRDKGTGFFQYRPSFFAISSTIPESYNFFLELGGSEKQVRVLRTLRKKSAEEQVRVLSSVVPKNK